jgi:hypothetical protein
MRSIRVALVAAFLLSLPLRSALAQNYQDSTGFYGQVAIVLGWPNIDGRFTAPPTTGNGTMIGLSFAAGSRIATWVGVDAEFVLIGGGDLHSFGVKTAESSLMAFTANAKLYPLAFSPDLIPQWVQPYGVIGIGGGIAQSIPVASMRDGFGAENVTVFMGRFGAGLEILLTDHWGTYVDGSYYMASDDVFNGAGTLRFGTHYSF